MLIPVKLSSFMFLFHLVNHEITITHVVCEFYESRMFKQRYKHYPKITFTMQPRGVWTFHECSPYMQKCNLHSNSCYFHWWLTLYCLL